jgi:hypothetical protein
MSSKQRDTIINLLAATILRGTACATIFAHVLREGCVGFKQMDDQQLQRAADCWDIEIDDVTG